MSNSPEGSEEKGGLGRGFGAGYAIVAAGFQLVFSILLFMGMGYLGDRWLGTKPWLMLLGIAVGLAAGFYAFMLSVKAEARPRGEKDSTP